MKRATAATCLWLATQLACAEGAPDGEAASAIIGGEPTQGDAAVVMLVAWPPDLSSFDTCTASLIGDDALLTAAHCVDEDAHPGFSFGVFPGPDASAFPTAATLVPQLLSVREIHIHPDYDTEPPFTADVAVVLLDAPLGVAPLPIARDAPPAESVGAPARIVGYGQRVYEEPNARKHTADTVLAAIDAGDTITVGDLMHKSCIGDSGGPALMDVDGVETVVGINSYTDLAGCLEPAHYRRTDLYLGFIDALVPPPATSGSSTGATSASTVDGASTATGTASSGGGDDDGEGGSDADAGGGGCAVHTGSTGTWPSLFAALVAFAGLVRRARREAVEG